MDSYRTLIWRVGKIKENDSIMNHITKITDDALYVNKKKYLSLESIYTKEKRYITPREYARILSFTEDFIFHPDNNITFEHISPSINNYNLNKIIKMLF